MQSPPIWQRLLAAAAYLLPWSDALPFAESLDNLPGTAPKRPVVDEAEPVVSVVMVRNLGNLRLLPAMVTLGSLLIFLAFCYMLHERDKVAMARAAESGVS